MQGQYYAGLSHLPMSKYWALQLILLFDFIKRYLHVYIHIVIPMPIYIYETDNFHRSQSMF